MLECDRPQRRRSVLLQVLEVDLGGGRKLKRGTRRSKFDEASSNVLVNKQDQIVNERSIKHIILTHEIVFQRYHKCFNQLIDLRL